MYKVVKVIPDPGERVEISGSCYWIFFILANEIS